MKYCLVQWTNNDLSPSIITEECILDKTMLFNHEKEGMIIFTKQRENQPMKQKLGRVIYVSEQKHVVERQQQLLLAETFASTNRKRPRSSSEDLTENYGKRPASSKNQEETTTIQEDSSNKQDESRLTNTVKKLQERVMKLEDELKSEKHLVKELQKANLALQNNLPAVLQQALQSCSVVQQLQASLDSLKCSCNKNNTIGDQTSSSEATENGDLNTPVSSPDVVTTSQEQYERLNQERRDRRIEREINDTFSVLEKLEALEVSIHPATMMHISEIPSYKKTTSALLSTLFERRILANSTVTGKNKAGRPALDHEKVGQIIGTAYVQHRFPDVEIRDIKATMAQKCKDTRITLTRHKSLVRTESEDHSDILPV